MNRTAAGKMAGMMIAAVALAAPVTSASQPDRGCDPIRQFEYRIAAYMQLQRAAGHDVPPLSVTASADEIAHAVEARAAAMRVILPGAAIGDIFSEDVASWFRMQIAAALSGTGERAPALLAEMIGEGGWGEDAIPAVNEPFIPSAMTPPAILDVLPPLPPELQYRFVGAHLVLVDIQSRLIVDVVPAALPVD